MLRPVRRNPVSSASRSCCWTPARPAPDGTRQRSACRTNFAPPLAEEGHHGLDGLPGHVLAALPGRIDVLFCPLLVDGGQGVDAVKPPVELVLSQLGRAACWERGGQDG